MLRDALDAAGRGSRADLAQTLRVSKTTITRWAQDHPPPDRVGEIEDALGLPAGSIDLAVPPSLDERLSAIESRLSAIEQRLP